MRYFRFSLRTLVLATLCAASGMMVYPRLAPWREEARLPAPPADPNANPFSSTTYSGNNVVRFMENDARLAVIVDSGLHVWNLKERTLDSRWGSWRSAFWMDACDAPLAILTKDKTHSIFSLARMEALFEVKADYLNSMQSADGSLISLVCPDCAEMWDCVAGKKLWAVSGDARATLSRDGKWAAVVENDSSVVRVCDARTGVTQRELKQDKARLYYALFSPDSSMVVGTGAESAGGYGYFVWSMRDGALISQWNLPANQIRQVAFSPDSRFVLVVGTGGNVRVWEIATGRAVLTFTASNSGSNCETLEYFPDGRRILIGYAAGGTVIYDAVTGVRLCAVPGEPDKAENVFITQNGERMAVLSRDGAVRILKYDHREEWWGVATLPEFWLAMVLAIGMGWSVVRDWRDAGRRSEVKSQMS